MAEKVTMLARDRALQTAKDLSKLNGISIESNTEYIMGLAQIALYNICEGFNSGESVGYADIPMVGSLKVTMTKLDKKNDPTFEFEFTPYRTFLSSVKRAYDTGVCELPKMIADRYGEKMTYIYNSILRGEIS